jgi:hypothetical protein
MTLRTVQGKEVKIREAVVLIFKYEYKGIFGIGEPIHILCSIIFFVCFRFDSVSSTALIGLSN